MIVGIVIPLALLFAFICLRAMGMSANLLSMGAIDFGIIIDGAVVMVEGVFGGAGQKSVRGGNACVQPDVENGAYPEHCQR